MMFDIHQGDCLEVMRGMADNSVDAVVTDPPYGLSFMGKRWDYDVPSVEIWAECLRVLKPGGHLLAFAGTRTQHRMAVRIEDAGFEIRDMIAWVYGSGFPKSLDVSKALDKTDASETRMQRALRFTEWVRSTGLTSSQIDAITGTNMGGHYTTAASQPSVATREHFEKLRPYITGEVPVWVEQMVDWRTVESENFKRREVVGTEMRYNEASGIVSAGRNERTLIERKITEAHTPAARQWQGWGTALKPALEPITMARKPLTGTVAENVLQHGTGALNIDGCRVPTDESLNGGAYAENGNRSESHSLHGGTGMNVAGKTVGREFVQPIGRWPANICHDGSDEVLAAFPTTTSGTGGVKRSSSADGHGNASAAYGKESRPAGTPIVSYGDTGSAARFFYCAKASRADRNEGLDEFTARTETAHRWTNLETADNAYLRAKTERLNIHPTVKPTDLMAYLCRLVTPPGGVVLDPFMGSGSTGKAAIREGFRFIGIERETEYIVIARARIEAQAAPERSGKKQMTLFQEAA